MTGSLFATETPTKVEPPALHTLRPYQVDAVDRVMDELRTHNSTLVVMPTGTGKTQCFCELARRMSNGRVLILAHTQELVKQAAARVKKVIGEHADIEMADHWAGTDRDATRIVVSSVQTQVAGEDGRGRMTRFSPKDFALVVTDEAHHYTSPMFQRVLNYYKTNPNLKIAGFSATPDRADEAALGQIFESVAYDYELPAAIEDGWLAPIKQSLIHVDGLDFSDIRTTGGDLNQGDLDVLLQEEKVLHRMVHPLIELARGRQTLVFAVTVAHAERMAEIFNRWRKDCARFVYGGTPDRERESLFESYGRKDFQFLCNVGIVTEGVDVPGIEVVAMGRPTKSRALFAQCIGRGTRPLPGLVDQYPTAAERRYAISVSAKPYCHVIDFSGNCGRHKLVSAADILGGNYPDEVLDLAQERMKAVPKEDGPADVTKELKDAEEELRRRKHAEAERRKHVKVKASYAVQSMDPFDILDVTPMREPGWHQGRKPSDKQVSFLGKAGVDIKNLSFCKASQLISEVIRRRNEGLASFKQLRLLSKNGIDGAELTFDLASEAIDLIASRQGWKR